MPRENHLLIIGIDEYASTHYQKIDNAKRDVERFKSVLEVRYGFKTDQALFNNKATRENITDALYDLQATCHKEDNLIIYYAGHGAQNPGSKVGAWVPFDGQSKPSNHILFSAVIDLIRGIKAKHILLISDCCYSGAFITRVRGGVNLNHEELDILNSRWVFVSAGEETVSDGEPGKGSPFNILVCETFEKNTAKMLSAGELFEQVIESINPKYPTPKAAVIPDDEHKGGQMIFRLIEAERDEINEIEKISFSIPKSPLKYYIPRTVTFYEHQVGEIHFFFEHERGKAYIKDVALTQKRIVLLGSAGSGKSIELQQLAKALSDNTYPNVPIYKRFNVYTGQDIEDYLPEGWSKVDPSITLIILDGLDEIQPEFFNLGIRKIMSFSEKYQKLKIIISCRTNFYDLPSDNFSGTLDNFSVFTLNDISLVDIINYTTDHFGINGKEFIKEVNEASFNDLIQKPFFLNIIIDQYINKGTIKVKRVDLIADALLNYYQKDKEHFKSTGPPLKKQEIFSILEKIAFIMEFMSKNFISSEELYKIFPSSLEFEKCKYLPAFKWDSEKDLWMFEHNNFQEFLASRVLATKTFDKLIEIISINGLEGRKIKPTWTNTISFFISINNSDKLDRLIEWITEHDTEIIVKFEPERISKEKRIDVFKQIFDFYGDREIWLSSNKFSDSEFARFGQYKEVLEFILSKIENIDLNRIVVINALHVVYNFDFSNFQDYIPRIKFSLIHLLDVSNLENYDTYYVLATLAKLKITDKTTVDYIIRKYSKRKNQYIRAGIYKLLHDSEFIDDYVNILIDGLDLARIDNAVEDRDSVTLGDEIFHLEIALKSIKRHDALRNIIEEFSSKKMNYTYIGDYKEVIQSIVQNSISAFAEHSTIYDDILLYFLNVVELFNKTMAEIITPFFEQTGTKRNTFNIIWNKKGISEYVRSESIDSLMDIEIIEDFLEDYKGGKFTEQDIKKLHEILSRKKYQNPDYVKWLKKLEDVALSVGNITFEPEVIYNWNEINRNKIQRSFDLLFDRESLLNEISRIYTKIGKEEIDQRDLFDSWSNHSENIEERFAKSAVDILREYTYRGRVISFKDLHQWIKDNPNFIDYQIEAIYEYLHGSNNNYIEVRKSQEDFITNWCVDKGNNWRFLWFFIFRFPVQLSEKKLLKLTLFYDFNRQENLKDPGTIDQLEKYLPKEKIKAQVVSNIEMGIEDTLVWVSNASYAIRQNLIKAYPNILNYLEGVSEVQYRLVEVLILWFSETMDTERLVDFIKKTKSDELKWKGISLLIDSGKEKTFVISYLKDILNTDNQLIENRFLASNYLMTFNNIEGVKFVANYILEKKDPQFDFRDNLSKLSKFSDSAAVPLLMKLLFLSKQPEFQKNDFNKLEPIIVDTLNNIGVQSYENLSIIKVAVDDFIKTNEDALDNLNFLYFIIKRIEEKLDIETSQSITIDYAINEWYKIQ